MSEKQWTIRRDQWGAATAIEMDGRTILHLLAGTERNESDGGAEMVLALLQAAIRLPQTEDGVVILPGDTVWHCRGINPSIARPFRVDGVERWSRARYHMLRSYSGDGPGILYMRKKDGTKAYSTCAKAEAAARANLG